MDLFYKEHVLLPIHHVYNEVVIGKYKAVTDPKDVAASRESLRHMLYAFGMDEANRPCFFYVKEVNDGDAPDVPHHFTKFVLMVARWGGIEVGRTSFIRSHTALLLFCCPNALYYTSV